MGKNVGYNMGKNVELMQGKYGSKCRVNMGQNVG